MLKRLSLADHAQCIQKPVSSASPTAFIKAFQHFEVKESAVAMFFTTTYMVRDSRNASLTSLKVKVHKQRDKCSNLCWNQQKHSAFQLGHRTCCVSFFLHTVYNYTSLLVYGCKFTIAIPVHIVCFATSEFAWSLGEKTVFRCRWPQHPITAVDTETAAWWFAGYPSVKNLKWVHSFKVCVDSRVAVDWKCKWGFCTLVLSAITMF